MITDSDLYQYFTLPDHNISHYDPAVMPFNTVIRGSSKLLVTLGDSWTWGDELDQRPSSCYGNILSQWLDADWLNLSVPGAGNHYIGQLYSDFVAYHKKQKNPYHSVLCVVTFTETARDFDGWFDRNVDYSSWLKQNITQPDDYYRFLEFINDFSIDKIVEQSRANNIETLIGFNFVNASSEEKIGNLLLDKTWLEVCRDEYNTDICYVVSPYIFDKLDAVLSMEWSLDRSIFQTWKMKLMEQTHKRLKLLEDSRYFYPRLHPTEKSHLAWAKYVYQKINSIGSKFIDQ